MKEINLGRSDFKAIVDDCDFAEVSKYKWQISNRKTPHSTKKIYRYAVGRINGGLLISLHKFLSNAPKGMYVDHTNGDGLDNRRENLRICSQSQNVANQKPRKGTITGFKGVNYFLHPRCLPNGRSKRYMARIKVNYKGKTLGYFHTAEEAARAYDAAAIKYFGEFANLNFKENNMKNQVAA